jgi:membrane protease YdiL (CAAX protease family)
MVKDYLKVQLFARLSSSLHFATLHSMYQSPFRSVAELEAENEQNFRVRAWRWLLGTLIIVIIWQAGGVVMILVAADLFQVPVEDLDTFPDVAPWRAGVITLVSFVPLFLIVPLLYRLLLRLSWRELISSRGQISIRRVFHGFVAMCALVLPLSAIDLAINREEYRYTFDFSLFWPYLIVALTLLPVQTTAEEFFFRGWLLRWNASGNWPVWAITALNASLFALPHMFNPEVKDYYILAFLYFAAMGAMLTLATLRDKSIEVAIGAHFANNLIAGVLISYQDSALPSAALLMSGELDWLASTVTAIVMVPLFLWLTRARAESQAR